MRAIIFFIISSVLCIYSYNYANKRLAKDGQYYASHYVIDKKITHFRISTTIKGNRFITHTHLWSEGLDKVAFFISDGFFLNDNENGEYETEYVMRRGNEPQVINENLAGPYINMSSRIGMLVNDKITILYHTSDFNVIDMGRNSNIIIFAKRQ